MSSWYVYIVECVDGTLYTGVTTDLQRRLRQHNGDLVGGAKYTQVRRPVRIVWNESQQNRSAACQREAAIKKLSRSDKLALVKQYN
ncbi:GIY-YIG nuclease family protein [Neptuniibacter pectenicola]|uniref:GIY-YIG nuclease family protein n=1 Tax=Neptuniibacter pectenicola TaxID=1806669 RepID=A0ABU9TMY2_9GAMM|nr:GIY-YIG nuclease family protein [Neptuniibacter pectenicola]KXJ51925.1 MAG: endonuclease [Neptuniibacter sp. Phe_28]